MQHLRAQEEAPGAPVSGMEEPAPQDIHLKGRMMRPHEFKSYQGTKTVFAVRCKRCQLTKDNRVHKSLIWRIVHPFKWR